jgi:hypothetical protein
MLAAGYQDDGIASATHVTVIVLDAYALEQGAAERTALEKQARK